MELEYPFEGHKKELESNYSRGCGGSPRPGRNVSNFNAQSSQSKIKILKSTAGPGGICWIWLRGRGGEAGSWSLTLGICWLVQLVVGNIRYEIKNTSLPTSKGWRGNSLRFREAPGTEQISWKSLNGQEIGVWSSYRQGLPFLSVQLEVQLKQLHLHSPSNVPVSDCPSVQCQFSVFRVASLADCMHVSLFFSPRAK